jgi:hypothetical protein
MTTETALLIARGSFAYMSALGDIGKLTKWPWLRRYGHALKLAAPVTAGYIALEAVRQKAHLTMYWTSWSGVKALAPATGLLLFIFFLIVYSDSAGWLHLDAEEGGADKPPADDADKPPADDAAD